MHYAFCILLYPVNSVTVRVIVLSSPSMNITAVTVSPIFRALTRLSSSFWTFPDNTVTLKAQQALSPDGRNGSPAVVGMFHPFTGGQHGIILAAEKNPVTILGNTNREHIIFVVVNIVQHRFCRAKRNLMLRAHTAKQHTYTEFFHFDRLILLKLITFSIWKSEIFLIYYIAVKSQEVLHAD